ncbi:hypothetical protein [Streptomyces sp. HUAS TT20]|uniref:hypothetical protein n=1 Tax=Streptomyces sp. HUAS TT20 TaxID=3447509 RepID=UPI0021D8F587|nr:hypothetical protein [Streptomyces sp. HUAS 15-9]UXY27981.1 hypothetical protein N8I87_16320 [Streptomyces sp. HUAS 15-9]
MPSAARVPRPSLVPALAALALLPLLAAAPAGAAGGWSVAPSGGGRPSFYTEGAPGTVQQDTVSVTNRGARPVTVRLSGTGVRVTFARARLSVPARTRADVPFTVAVPAGAAPGDRAGTITARDTDGRTATVPVRLCVAGPALSALTVEHLAVHAERITYELVNRGTTVLVPRLAVRVDGVFGPVLERAPRTLPVRLPPGRRLRLDEPWPDRPALDAVDVRLTVTASGGARDSASTSVRCVPWGGVATGAALAAGAATACVVRRRRRRTTGSEAQPPCVEAESTGVLT